MVAATLAKPAEPLSWHPSKYGCAVEINRPWEPMAGRPVSTDVETDEADNIVGFAVTDDGVTAHYYAGAEALKTLRSVEFPPLIGHSIKGDIRWMRSAGARVSEANIYADTMIQSYVINPTKDSHALKTLAKERLGWEWPTYKQMTGRRNTKEFKTLDELPVETVANYCGLDCLATFRLYQRQLASMDSSQLWFYENVEMPLYKLLFIMEDKGIKVDVAAMRELDARLLAEIGEIKTMLQAVVGKRVEIIRGKKKTKEIVHEFNPNSPKQIQELLFKILDIHEKDTDKKILVKYQSKPEIKALLHYRKITKMQGTYTGGLLRRPTLPIINTSFNQVTANEAGDIEGGISTTRLSSSDPNLQNIPSRGDYGKALRGMFIARDGQVFVRADYSQMEYRGLAHITGEPKLLEIFRTGQDIHASMAAMLFRVPLASVTPEQRDIAKTFNFAVIYGSQPPQISNVTGLSVPECEKILTEYWNNLPAVCRWVLKVKADAHRLGGVKTMLGHWIPLPGINAANRFEQYHWERAAVNYVIQGGCAEIIKLAMLRLQKQGVVGLLAVHDELLVECPIGLENGLKEVLKATMENIIKLAVPLKVEVGVGHSWQEAKEAA